MKKDNPEEEINVIISDNDSELIERLKEIISQTSHKLPNIE
jgi:hypothetical protein